MVPLVLVGTARWLHIQAESVEAKVTIATTTLSLFMPLRSIDAPTRHRCRNRACGGTSDATNWTGESKAGDTTRRASADRLLGCRAAAQRQGDYDRKNKPRTHSNPSLAKIERPRHTDTDLPEPPRESRDSTVPPSTPTLIARLKVKFYPFLNDRLNATRRCTRGGNYLRQSRAKNPPPAEVVVPVEGREHHERYGRRLGG
jgi:hypothetical protein